MYLFSTTRYCKVYEFVTGIPAHAGTPTLELDSQWSSKKERESFLAYLYKYRSKNVHKHFLKI